ncbi:hypothetical protein [Oceanobacillus senegalensis]|uniref:hypothetical protein n=1 Tax=Oceanobacillus senegalensis TaxID=1936063 RepID=UPI000A3097BD|nr:hypothetical protein [Oceanobacillus senegalensis]
MAFGLKRDELKAWKRKVKNGEVAIITHYWMDDRFPDSYTVTKVGCSDIARLIEWGKQYGLKQEWIHNDEQYPHFDLFGEHQQMVLKEEKHFDQLERFNLGF